MSGSRIPRGALVSNRYLRGSTEQCPKCGCRKIAVDMEKTHNGFGPGIAVCENCRAIWEPFDPSQIWDTSVPLCSFKEPCNNCAFRPGSNEQQDREEWKKLIGSLKNGAGFYCHKGVPIEPDAEHGYAYPKSGKDPSRLRHCRGYLNALRGMWRARVRKARP